VVLAARARLVPVAPGMRGPVRPVCLGEAGSGQEGQHGAAGLDAHGLSSRVQARTGTF